MGGAWARRLLIVSDYDLDAYTDMPEEYRGFEVRRCPNCEKGHVGIGVQLPMVYDEILGR